MATTILKLHDPVASITAAGGVVALLRPTNTDYGGYTGFTRDVVDWALRSVQMQVEQARVECEVDLASQHLQQAASLVKLLQPGAPGDEGTGYRGMTKEAVEDSLGLIAGLLDQALAAVEAA